jgi:hypothetical protein
VAPHTLAELAAAGLLPAALSDPAAAPPEQPAPDPIEAAERAAIQAEPEPPPKGTPEYARWYSAHTLRALENARTARGLLEASRQRPSYWPDDGSPPPRGGVLRDLPRPTVVAPGPPEDRRDRNRSWLALRHLPAAGPPAEGPDQGSRDMTRRAKPPGGRSRFVRRPARTHPRAAAGGLPPEQRAAMAAAWSAQTGIPPELWLGPVLEPVAVEPADAQASPGPDAGDVE